MKFPKLAYFLSFSAITLATTLISSSPSFSQQRTFICDINRDGFPATIVQSPIHGNVPIIIWNSGFFEGGGYDNQTRCDIVSRKFQNFNDKGTLKFFTAGRVNRQPVICVVASMNEPCDRDSLLFTLKPNSNAQEKLRRLVDIRSGASSQALEETYNIRAGDRLYVDFEKFLEKKANAESGINQNLSPINSSPINNQNSDDSLETQPLF